MAPDIQVVPTIDDHIEYVAKHMRLADCEEVFASSKSSPLSALSESVKFTNIPLTGVASGVPFCIFGVSSINLLSDVGFPWLLGTELVKENYRSFLKASRAYVESWSQSYSLLENYVDARNSLSIRWLKWLGFTLEEARPWGQLGLPFHHFYKERNYV